jgi:hypothetical protein
MGNLPDSFYHCCGVVYWLGFQKTSLLFKWLFSISTTPVYILLLEVYAYSVFWYAAKIVMTLSSITITCPACGSKEIVYSCTPDCCFNHVCGDCLHNFQLGTKDTGESLASINVKAEERDSCAPTARCARCESLDLYRLTDDEKRAGDIVCAVCRALLRLLLTAE